MVIRNLQPDAPLVIAANRDESYARPWKGPGADPEAPEVWRPIDRAAGGTWIGVHGAHLAVAVTNRRPAPGDSSRRSRGLLCADTLRMRTPAEACAGVEKALARSPYNDFNMLVANRHEAYVIHHEADRTRIIALPDGVHILSNFHDLDDPIWQPNRLSLAEAAGAGWPALHDALVDELASHAPASDGHLTCKHGERYGTLCGAIIRLAPRHPPQFFFAPGAPCTTAFTAVPVT